MNKSYKSFGKLWLTLSLLLSWAAGAWAQVNFEVLPVAVGGDINEEAANTIFRKTEQILTRNSAAAAGVADVFGVEATLTLTNKAQTTGLVRDVTSLSGEFTLVALNKVDGAKYYSVAVPVKAASKTGGIDPIVALANSIKPTDAVYTRFVRIAREKIEEYYNEHCSEVIGRAKTLGESGQLVAAMVYLTGVPASAPCHEEALEMIAELRTNINRISAEQQPVVEQPADADPEVNVEPAIPVAEVPEEEEAAPTTTPSDDYMGELYVENPDWDFKLRSAQYLPSAHKIELVATITYKGKTPLRNDCFLGFKKVVDENGDTYDNRYVDGSSFMSFPDDVPVKVVYYINDVKKNPGKLTFIGLSIQHDKVEIRNLPIRQ